MVFENTTDDFGLLSNKNGPREMKKIGDNNEPAVFYRFFMLQIKHTYHNNNVMKCSIIYIIILCTYVL